MSSEGDGVEMTVDGSSLDCEVAVLLLFVVDEGSSVRPCAKVDAMSRSLEVRPDSRVTLSSS